MKKKLRVLSLLLVLVMFLGFVPKSQKNLQAAAAGIPDKVQISVKKSQLDGGTAGSPYFHASIPGYEFYCMDPLLRTPVFYGETKTIRKNQLKLVQDETIRKMVFYVKDYAKTHEDDIKTAYGAVSTQLRDGTATYLYSAVKDDGIAYYHFLHFALGLYRGTANERESTRRFINWAKTQKKSS